MPPVLPALAGVAVLTGLAVHRRRAWAARGIRLGLPLPALAAGQALVALAAAWPVAVRFGAPAAAGAAAAAWLGVLAVASDLASRRVPREACHGAALVGLAALAVAPTAAGLLAAATATVGLVAVPWAARALTRGGLGFGDIRLLWAFSATLSWWAGQDRLLVALLTASLAQLGVHVGAWVLSRRSRRGGGSPGPGEGRRVLPFAPALVLATAGGAAVATATGAGACLAWGGLGC